MRLLQRTGRSFPSVSAPCAGRCCCFGRIEPTKNYVGPHLPCLLAATLPGQRSLTISSISTSAPPTYSLLAPAGLPDRKGKGSTPGSRTKQQQGATLTKTPHHHHHHHHHRFENHHTALTPCFPEVSCSHTSIVFETYSTTEHDHDDDDDYSPTTTLDILAQHQLRQAVDISLDIAVDLPARVPFFPDHDPESPHICTTFG